MLIGGIIEAKLLEDLRDVGFDCSFAQEDACRDGAVAQSLGDEGEHLSFPDGQAGQGSLSALSPDHARHDGGVDDGVSVGDPAYGVDKDGAVEDALFEDVADSFRLIFDETHRVARLDVLREHEDADRGMLRRWVLPRGLGAAPRMTRPITAFLSR